MLIEGIGFGELLYYSLLASPVTEAVLVEKGDLTILSPKVPVNGASPDLETGNSYSRYQLRRLNCMFERRPLGIIVKRPHEICPWSRSNDDYGPLPRSVVARMKMMECPDTKDGFLQDFQEYFNPPGIDTGGVDWSSLRRVHTDWQEPTLAIKFPQA